MSYIIVVVLSLLYLASCYGCIVYFVDKDIDINILSILILFCPIINTILAFKCKSIKETIQQLKEKEK